MRVTMVVFGLFVGATHACKGPDFSKKPGAAAAAPAPIAVTTTPAKPTAPTPLPVAAPIRPVPAPAAQAPKGPAGTNIGERIAKFDATLVDLGSAPSKTSRLDSQAKGPVTVYTIIGTTCPATRAYIERQKALETSLAPKGVRFVYLYPNVDETEEVKQRFHKTSGYAGALVDDQGSKIAKALGSIRTSENIVADKDQKIAYRGPIDDSRSPAGVKHSYLADALDALLAGKSPSVTYATVFA